MTQHLPEIPPAILGIRCNGCGTREEVALPQPVEDLDAEARYLATRLAREGWDIDPDNPGRPTRCALCVATGIKVAPVAALAMRGPHGGGYRGGAPASEVGPPRSVPSETIRIPVPAPTVSPLWADRIAAELARHHADKVQRQPDERTRVHVRRHRGRREGIVAGRRPRPSPRRSVVAALTQ